MQPDQLFWHRALDRRVGVVIPFPVRQPAHVAEAKLPPHKAFCALVTAIVGMWLLILLLYRVLVSL